MGCFGSTPEKKEDTSASAVAGQTNKSPKKQAPPPEDPPTPALPETEDSKETKTRIETEGGKPIKNRIYKSEFTLSSVNLEDGWKDFGYIKEATECKTIDLSYTDFNDMQSLHNCKRMRVLNLENASEGVDEDEYSLPHRLEELNIEGTNFVNWGCFKELKHFKKLLASGLDDLDDKTFEWPKSLEFLDLGATDFTDLKSLKGLPNLKHLDLRACEGDLSGKCPLEPGKLDFLDIEETNFDDVEFLKKLREKNKRLNLNCNFELKEKLGFSRKSMLGINSR